MKKFLGFIAVITFVISGFAAGIELDNGGKLTPMVDATAYTQWLYNGTTNYEKAEQQVFAEIGGRYDKSTPNTDYFSSITMYHEDQINDPSKSVQLGDLNLGFTRGHHTFIAGRGKYPVGIILANHNVNQRKEIWSPTDLSIFLSDIIGDRCNALFYQYENGIKDLNYKLKFIGTKNKFYNNIVYGDPGVDTAIPIVSIELNYKRVTFESTYSNYHNGDVITYMNGVEIRLPSQITVEFQQTTHKRRSFIGYSSAGTVDDKLLISLFGGPCQVFSMGQEYSDVELILEKESTLFNHRIVYFTQGIMCNTSDSIIFATQSLGNIPGSLPPTKWKTAYQYRFGASYWMTDELSVVSEYERNHILSVLPNWKDRISVGLRLKI